MLIRPSTMLAGVLALSAFAAHAAPVAPSPPDSVVYAVRAGDNLYTLGQRFLVDAAAVRTVQRLNAIVDPRRVPTATRLRIPVALLRAEPLTAQLIAVHGAVHITSDGHDLPATAGADVPQGASVETGGDGFVTLALPNGSRTALPTLTRLRIVHLRRFLLTGSIDYDFTVEAGKAETEATPLGADGNSTFRIRTPLAVAAVRGTRFRVGLTGDASLAEVLEGTVAAGQAGAEPVPVPHGFGAVVTPAGVHQEALLAAPDLVAPGRVQVDPLVRLELAAEAGPARFPVKIAGYHVQIAADAGFTNVLAETRGPGPVFSFADIPNGGLFVRVSALAASGLEGMSQTYAMRRVLTGLTAAAVADADALRFQWGGAGAGARTYHFQLARDDKGGQPVIDEAGLTTGGITVHALPPGVWFWRVGVRQAAPDGVTENWQPFAKITIAAPER